METTTYKLFGFIPIMIVKRVVSIDHDLVAKIALSVKSDLTNDINKALNRVRG